MKYATPFPMLHAVSLLSHRSRLSKFQRALQKVVQPESRVVDIGTGTGILALIAARAGAKSVTAVEVNGKSLNYARKAAQINGLSQRVSFVESHFEDYVPEEQADIVICEMLSSMLLIEQQVPACAHAARRILKPGGIILPVSASVYAVPVECQSLWERFNLFDLEFPKVPQTLGKGDAKDLSDAALVTKFDFSIPDIPAEVNEMLEFVIVEEGRLHGLVGFFKAHLYEDITLGMDDGWRELFLPLDEPIEVSKGTRVSVQLRFKPGEFDSLKLGKPTTS
ncbi:MAG: methyltransferase domain-containing protein [Candidatus Thorarchaeota archaeon]|nr:MAG: methyltransferase domain-containing protein [Candidatus Thorarchaeota archaeon]